VAVQSAPAAPPSDALGGPRPGPEDAHPGSVGFLPKLGNKSPSAARDSGIITRSDGVLLSDGPAGEGRASLDKRERGDDSSCKEPLLKDPGGLAEGRTEEKQPLPAAGRRRRRFTGDSGIEVCVCGRSSGAGVREGRELKELESLLGCAEDEDEDDEEEEGDGSGDGEFCENCGPRAHLSEDEEQAQGVPERRVDREPWAAPQPAHQTSSSSDAPPTPSLLHTVNEQEGPHHGPEPQG